MEIYVAMRDLRVLPGSLQALLQNEFQEMMMTFRVMVNRGKASRLFTQLLEALFSKFVRVQVIDIVLILLSSSGSFFRPKIREVCLIAQMGGGMVGNVSCGHE